jgi:hypothetical protein
MKGIPNVLEVIKETDQCVYLYTCPAKTNNDDTNQVLTQYREILQRIPENKQWVWIIDTSDFGWE